MKFIWWEYSNNILTSDDCIHVPCFWKGRLFVTSWKFNINNSHFNNRIINTCNHPYKTQQIHSLINNFLWHIPIMVIYNTLSQHVYLDSHIHIQMYYTNIYRQYLQHIPKESFLTLHIMTSMLQKPNSVKPSSQ